MSNLQADVTPGVPFDAMAYFSDERLSQLPVLREVEQWLTNDLHKAVSDATGLQAVVRGDDLAVIFTVQFKDETSHQHTVFLPHEETQPVTEG